MIHFKIFDKIPYPSLSKTLNRLGIKENTHIHTNPFYVDLCRSFLQQLKLWCQPAAFSWIQRLSDKS